MGTTLVVTQKLDQLEFEGKKYGPLAPGDLAGSLPEGLVSSLRTEGKVALFDYSMLAGELLG